MFGSTPIDPGTTLSLEVAVDAVSSKNFQRFKLADATDGLETAIGIDANPLKVLNRRRGTSNYDSGRVSIGNGAPALVTATTIYPEGGTLSNTAAVTRKVTLADGSDNTLMILTIAAESTIQLPVPTSGAWAGLKAGADGTGCVLQVAGGQ